MKLTITPSEAFRIGILCFLVGFIVPYITHISLIFLSIISITLGLVCYFAPINKTLKHITIFLLCVFLGATYHSFRDTTYILQDDIVTHEKETVTIQGIVDSFPDHRETSSRAYVQATHINNKTAKGRFLLVTKPNTTYDYGDTIEVKGKVTIPQQIEDFDYAKYLYRFKVQTIIRNPKKIEILSTKNQGNWFLHTAKDIRNSLENKLKKNLPSPHNTIAMGLLLGVKNQLPYYTQDSFHNAGIQHILVVSGFNVTVLVLFVSLLFKKLGRPFLFVTTLGSILFYAAMTGAEAPVIRASIMGAIVGFAAVTGRFTDARNLLLFSLLLIGLYKPLTILQDSGLLLSFSATIGIILLTPLFESKILSFIPNTFQIRTLLSVSLAAQLSVFPFLALTFGQIQPIGLISNLFTEPLIPLAMLFAGAVILNPFTFGLLGKIIALPAFIILEILLWIGHLAGVFQPINISKHTAIISICLISLFFLFGLFSRWYQKTILEKADSVFDQITLKSNENKTV